MSAQPKVRHVLRAKQTRQHVCHWPGCLVQVPPAKWGCRVHWFKLPRDIRNRIWQEYRPGQEDDLNVSSPYIAAAEAAQRWIKENG